MKATALVQNPDDVVLEVRLTMPLKDWREFLKKTDSNGGFGVWPVCEVHDAIQRAIWEIDRTVTKEILEATDAG